MPHMQRKLRPRTAPRPGMVWIPGGSFRMGSDVHYAEEAPTRQVEVEGFWIDERPVTNRDFAAFVAATGWVTTAEQPADPADYPGADPAMLAPSSLVFFPTAGAAPLHDIRAWWRYTAGADWRHPYGPGSSIEQLLDHPVVHVSWADVEAYAVWAGADLSTEAEWEFAARGGLEGKEYAWGDAFEPGGRPMAKTWQGRFPFENLDRTGWPRTAPVGSYPPNGYGLLDMIGNTWEWTSDWWSTASTEPVKGCCAASRSQAAMVASYDPNQPEIRIPRKVLKGGSHLCAPSYCRRYRPAARHAQPVDTSTSHVGFRVVVRP
ncbi:formylglycine-generating enzyme family protein [Phenylobacterium sp.]|uniref:formylglycine-generating enzyme family protein n=1 Tax=Phenylobacterium sp. TaxID=1871053 RepID=UPI00289EC711|nr:formylglycine-generating enzyme family protein [Phenylobacterium sp.]